MKNKKLIKGIISNSFILRYFINTMNPIYASIKRTDPIRIEKRNPYIINTNSNGKYSFITQQSDNIKSKKSETDSKFPNKIPLVNIKQINMRKPLFSETNNEEINEALKKELLSIRDGLIWSKKRSGTKIGDNTVGNHFNLRHGNDLIGSTTDQGFSLDQQKLLIQILADEIIQNYQKLQSGNNITSKEVNQGKFISIKIDQILSKFIKDNVFKIKEFPLKLPQITTQENKKTSVKYLNIFLNNTISEDDTRISTIFLSGYRNETEI